MFSKIILYCVYTSHIYSWLKNEKQDTLSNIIFVGILVIKLVSHMFQRIADRDKRKETVIDNRAKEKENELIEAIHQRGIKFYGIGIYYLLIVI